MLINRIIVGYVVQRYDTEKGKFVSQAFIAEEGEAYADGITGQELGEDELPESVKDTICYTFMKQPE